MKTAVVTGANRGLGYVLSKELINQGFQVICLGRKDPILEKAIFIPVDLTNEKEIEIALEQVKLKIKSLDLLVNNAGVFLDKEKSFFDLKIETLLDTLKVNLFAPIKLIQGLETLFIDGSQIINISSTFGKLDQMRGLNTAYRISKTALNTVTRVVSQELSHKNIQVNSVCPGWVRTDMGGSQAAKSVKEGIDSILWLATNKHNYNGHFIRGREELTW